MHVDVAEDDEVDRIRDHVRREGEVIRDDFGRGRGRIPHPLKLEVAEQDSEVRVLQLIRAVLDPLFPSLPGDFVRGLAGDLFPQALPDLLHDLFRVEVGDEDEPDFVTIDLPNLALRFPEDPDVRVAAVVIEGRRAGGPPRLVVVPREDPDLDSRGAERLDHVFADHLSEHGRHVGPVEQVPEDAE